MLCWRVDFMIGLLPLDNSFQIKPFEQSAPLGQQVPRRRGSCIGGGEDASPRRRASFGADHPRHAIQIVAQLPETQLTRCSYWKPQGILF
jgi:hypothetical protein